MSYNLCSCGNSKESRAKRCRPCYEASLPRGPAHQWWRGGTYRDKCGYVRRQAPAHPRACASGYVLEHILVMEEKLGRYLLADENVHHKNTIRDDNRPENLELWVGRGSQPRGGRAEDLLAWARELIARYDG